MTNEETKKMKQHQMPLPVGPGWPTLLDWTPDECRMTLRKIELNAYCGIVSALRAQGDLDKERKELLRSVAAQLGISMERHQAECRRAANDEKLNTIACVLFDDPECVQWRVEGRRLVPLMRRPVIQNATAPIASAAAAIQKLRNDQLPHPAATANTCPPKVNLTNAPPPPVPGPPAPVQPPPQQQTPAPSNQNPPKGRKRPAPKAKQEYQPRQAQAQPQQPKPGIEIRYRPEVQRQQIPQQQQGRQVIHQGQLLQGYPPGTVVEGQRVVYIQNQPHIIHQTAQRPPTPLRGPSRPGPGQQQGPRPQIQRHHSPVHRIPQGGTLIPAHAFQGAKVVGRMQSGQQLVILGSVSSPHGTSQTLTGAGGRPLKVVSASQVQSSSASGATIIYPSSGHGLPTRPLPLTSSASGILRSNSGSGAGRQPVVFVSGSGQQFATPVVSQHQMVTSATGQHYRVSLDSGTVLLPVTSTSWTSGTPQRQTQRVVTSQSSPVVVVQQQESDDQLPTSEGLNTILADVVSAVGINDLPLAPETVGGPGAADAEDEDDRGSASTMSAEEVDKEISVNEEDLEEVQDEEEIEQQEGDQDEDEEMDD